MKVWRAFSAAFVWFTMAVAIPARAVTGPKLTGLRFVMVTIAALYVLIIAGLIAGVSLHLRNGGAAGLGTSILGGMSATARVIAPIWLLLLLVVRRPLLVDEPGAARRGED